MIKTNLGKVHNTRYASVHPVLSDTASRDTATVISDTEPLVAALGRARMHVWVLISLIHKKAAFSPCDKSHFMST